MPSKPYPLSRRDFLRLSALGLGSLAGGRLLSACSPNPAINTAATVPSINALPTATETASATIPATLAVGSRPEIIQFFPDIPSRVVQTHHSGVWSEKALVPGALRQMLDASITRLTGLNDARAAWAALFKPGERIAIKVNTFRNGLIWTHAP